MRFWLGVVLLILGSILMFGSCGIRKKESKMYGEALRKKRPRTTDADINAYYAVVLFFFSFKVLKSVYDEKKAHAEGRNDQWT